MERTRYVKFKIYWKEKIIWKEKQEKEKIEHEKEQYFDFRVLIADKKRIERVKQNGLRINSEL